MWHPEPGWQPLATGLGTSTAGVWLAGDRVVKRLHRPGRDDLPELSDPTHFAYWHRPVDVALSAAVEATPGLHGPPTEVDEDADGATVWTPHLDPAPPSGLYVTRCLGRFAGAVLPDADWLARDQLADRVRRVEQRGGWPTLARTTVADVADVLWARRQHFVDGVAALPQVPQHGDPTPDNLLAHDADGVLAVDWATLGLGPVGADLGYFALAAREELEPLLDAYVGALPPGLATADQVALGARVSGLYTAFSRAEWALARAAAGEGALAGKLHHPAVAPYLRSLQRLLPQVEHLLA